MSKILVHISVLRSGEYDIFQPTDYKALKGLIVSNYNSSCPNIGNRLWFQGLISEISTPENTIEYWDETLTPDQINERYDMLIAPMANIFSVHFIELMRRFTSHIKGLRIPVFVIACGVQAAGISGISNLIDVIRTPAYEMIKAVYETGGEFALRGYVTKEFFEKMGFPSAVVTGCPSLYQCGRTSSLLNVDEKVSIELFKPAFNGNLGQQATNMKKFPNSEFFDQENYFTILHDPDFWKNNISSGTLVKNFGFNNAEILTSGRVCLIADMGAWKSYLQANGFNFSYGSRIHGNIMPILSGIPAVLWAQDARTSEIADFFGIPTVNTAAPNIYDIYMKADYSVYNRQFSKHFDDFEHFLKQHGIVSKINTDNKFLNKWSGLSYCPANSKKLREMYLKIERHRTFYQVQQLFSSVYHKLRSRQESKKG